MTKNGRQQILEAAIRVMSEVGITPPRKDRAMTNIIRRQAFHSNLDELHIEDISLHGATCTEAEEAYIARFGEMPADIDMDFELCLWQEHNPVCAPADFKAQDGAYIRDTTPISAEAWEAMHGIGIEPAVDDRTVMMIRRRIVEDTAGYHGFTKFDSVKVWRLYATPSGEIWGAQWTHLTASGDIDWADNTWGTMQHIRSFIDATAELNDTVAEWERY